MNNFDFIYFSLTNILFLENKFHIYAQLLKPCSCISMTFVKQDVMKLHIMLESFHNKIPTQQITKHQHITKLHILRNKLLKWQVWRAKNTGHTWNFHLPLFELFNILLNFKINYTQGRLKQLWGLKRQFQTRPFIFSFINRKLKILRINYAKALELNILFWLGSKLKFILFTFQINSKQPFVMLFLLFDCKLHYMKSN